MPLLEPLAHRRAGADDEIPLALLLGRAHRVGLIDATVPGAVNVTTEDELGPLLLAIVASAKAGGLDAERALRASLRELQVEIRDREIESASDAAVIDATD